MNILNNHLKHFIKLSIILFIIVVSCQTANATSNQIDSVLIKKDDTILLEVHIKDYINAYITEDGSIYDFLKDQEGIINIAGIKTGDKYVDIKEYVNNYILYSPNQTQVLEESTPISQEMLHKIKNISEYKMEIVNVKIGEVEGSIEGNQIFVKIPKEIADLPMQYIELNFSNEVKIVEIDEELPWIDIINRFNDNGYDLNNYYSNYKVRSSWSYTKLIKTQASTSYTVITKDGYKETFYINVCIE